MFVSKSLTKLWFFNFKLDFKRYQTLFKNCHVSDESPKKIRCFYHNPFYSLQHTSTKEAKNSPNLTVYAIMADPQNKSCNHLWLPGFALLNRNQTCSQARESFSQFRIIFQKKKKKLPHESCDRFFSPIFGCPRIRFLRLECRTRQKVLPWKKCVMARGKMLHANERVGVMCK